MNKTTRYALCILLLVLILPATAVARGEPDIAPAVRMSSESGVNISPNGDGIQDVLTLSPVLADESTRAIKSFQLTVFGTSESTSGQLIWTRTEVQTETRGFFGNLLNVGEEPAVAIPDTLTWDGTYQLSDLGADGEQAPDGDYIYQLIITDDSGASVSTPPMNVRVDRRAPTIELFGAPYSVFSPNGDGVRDDVNIIQRASREYLWTGTVVDSEGEAIRTFTWENMSPDDRAGDASPPQDISWDGTSDSGSIVPDGIYTYTLAGADRAGNSVVSEPVTVRVSTVAGAVQLLPRNTHFSPNGDGSLDTLTLDTVISDTEGLVDYVVALTAPGEADEDLWSLSGAAPVPETVVLNGLDRRGWALSDGQYEVTLSVSYENGNQAQSEPAAIILDTSAPGGVIRVVTGPVETPLDAPLAFGGATKQYVDVSVSLSEPSGWIAAGSLGDATISVPLAELGVTDTDFTFRWSGSDLTGEPLADGLATLQFRTTDPAGNAGQTNLVRVIKDTSSAEVSVEFLGDYISPDDDGVNDSVGIATTYSASNLIDQFLLSIEDDRGRIIRTEYKRTPFTSFEWLGRSNGGTVVADGTYYANLQVIYHNGDEPIARSGPITVDSSNPRVLVLTAPYRLFSPDGDGERDTVDVQQETSDEDEWVGRITAVDGLVVFERTWTGRARSFTWDGTGPDGEVVPDGDYTYRVQADDPAGNEGGEDLTLVVDTRSAPVSQQPPDVSVSTGPLPFTPDGDGTNDRLMITMAAASENTLSSWELVITDPFGGEMRRWSGRGAPRSFISWNGESLAGELVQSAQEYTATLSVTDDHGNTGTQSAVIAVGILVIRDGLTLRIMVPSIHFAPYTADLFEVSAENLEQNLETLRNLAAVLNRYEDYEILIEGHAAHDYYVDGPRKDREQEEELLPLSASRAEEVRQAMIILGVASDRMRTIGIGGARPIVPHSDRENLWKNRRVEFILERR